MPFQSEKQRRYMHANLPEIANRWEKKYGLGGIAELNSQLNSLPEYYLPKNQGGRIGYDKGLKVWPKAEIIQSGSTPDSGIDVSERDITYGLSGSYQGDNLYAGGDYETGNVNVTVQEEDNVIFEDTMSKEDVYKLYVGLGQQEGNNVEVGTDTKGNYFFKIVKSFNQGGLIPSHEAGIYGLAEGGQLVKPGPGRPGYGGPHETEQAGRDYADTSPSDVGSGGGAQYRGGETYMAPVDVTSTYTTTAPTTDDETAKEKYISEQYKKKRDIYAGADLEEQLEIDKRIAQRKLDYGRNLTKQEKKNLEVGLGFRPAKTKNKFLSFLGNAALAIIPGLLPAKLATTFRVGKLGYDLAYTDKYDATIAKFGFNKNDLLSKGRIQFSTEEKLREETQKLKEALPKNHPESIALEAQTKTKTPPKMDEDGVNIKYTSEEITDTNDAKAGIARLEQKYLEMNEASRLARQRQQQMNRDKQEAYYKMFRDTYMSAQGGRVPGGYNTGGLSNLFRLKNR